MNTFEQQFSDFYQGFSKASVQNLGDIYADSVEFVDPVHHVYGLSSLTDYFERLLSETTRCQFIIHQLDQAASTYYVTWTMDFSHPKLKFGRPIQLSGISKVKINNEKVIYQRDYYDMGEMLYEHVPLVGFATRFLKSRL